MPAVDNTNTDRSVATIHATVVACMRRRAQARRRPHLALAPDLLPGGVHL